MTLPIVARRSAASTVLTAVYGMEPIKSKDDPLVVRINVSVVSCLHTSLFWAEWSDVCPI
jgi:hypothetical protein